MSARLFGNGVQGTIRPAESTEVDERVKACSKCNMQEPRVRLTKDGCAENEAEPDRPRRIGGGGFGEKDCR